MPSGASGGMRPTRDSARARAASTSSIACTQARSETVAIINSVLRLGPKSASDGREDRLPFTLESDVEVQHATAALRDQRFPTGGFDEAQYCIGRGGGRRVMEIHTG